MKIEPWEKELIKIAVHQHGIAEVRRISDLLYTVSQHEAGGARHWLMKAREDGETGATVIAEYKESS